MVNVGYQQGESGAEGLRAADLLLYPLVQDAAAENAGQAVHARQPFHLAEQAETPHGEGDLLGEGRHPGGQFGRGGGGTGQGGGEEADGLPGVADHDAGLRRPAVGGEGLGRPLAGQAGGATEAFGRIEPRGRVAAAGEKFRLAGGTQKVESEILGAEIIGYVAGELPPGRLMVHRLGQVLHGRVEQEDLLLTAAGFVELFFGEGQARLHLLEPLRGIRARRGPGRPARAAGNNPLAGDRRPDDRKRHSRHAAGSGISVEGQPQAGQAGQPVGGGAEAP